MSGPSDDLPEAAQRRLQQGSFSSGLSVADFGACLDMGLEPVGLVQGFCAMHWGAYSMGVLGRGAAPFAGGQSGYVQNYQCPHNMVSAEHRSWGQNYQQGWIEDAWRTGFNNAYSRMMQEAQSLGAHGVVGIVDAQNPLSDTGVIEFHLRGTAVTLRDATTSSTTPPTTPPTTPWSTFLAGQRLAKVFEAGYAPVTIVTSVASVRMWSYCITEFLLDGNSGTWANTTGPSEIHQVVDAQNQVRDLVRSRVRSSLHGDALLGGHLEVSAREIAKGDFEFQSRLSGNRVRRFKDFEPLAVPRPTVRLS